MQGGETAVRNGNDGEKMMKGFLQEIGWENLMTHQQFLCYDNLKHSSKKGSERTSHNVDGIFYYDSPLNHQETDIVLCSSKHNQDEYSSKTNLYSYIKDLAQSIECATKDHTLNNDIDAENKDKSFKGVLFWVSSNLDEQSEDIISQIGNIMIENEDGEKPKLRGLNYDSIYLVDNNRATFIYSAIKTAKAFRPNIPLKFLYPHTGFNNQNEDLMTAGEILPIQYINTSILPIVLDGDQKISVLIFCNTNFDKENLRRLIWFAHKISGLTNEIVLYFNDYDATSHKAEENSVKQSFKDNSLTNKIALRKTTVNNFTTLKEEPNNNLVPVTTTSRINIDKKSSEHIENDLDKILPFGEMLKPLLASTILSDSDIKAFLIHRGIYLGSSDKYETIPLLSTLLLSPEDLNTLKYMLKTKEDKVKNVSRTTKLISNVSLAQIQQSISNNFQSINVPKNCTLIDKPKVSYYDNEIIIDFAIEKQNSTHDLITGKQRNSGSISVKIDNGNLSSQLNYTSRETYDYCTKMFKQVENELLAKQIINEEFFSVKFNMFDNTGRINFFLNLLNLDSGHTFTSPELEQILIKPDSEIQKKLPFDLESLKGKVKELNILGRALDSVHYFNADYKEFLLMQKVKIKYAFEHGIHSGHCFVDVDFKNAISEGELEAELHFNIDIAKTKGNKGKNLESVRKDLSTIFSNLIQNKAVKFQKELVPKKTLATQ
jgi:hypothetical protein